LVPFHKITTTLKTASHCYICREFQKLGFLVSARRANEVHLVVVQT